VLVGDAFRHTAGSGELPVPIWESQMNRAVTPFPFRSHSGRVVTFTDVETAVANILVCGGFAARLRVSSAAES